MSNSQVTIIVDNGTVPARTFTVSEDLLCSKSDYFRALFQGHFSETTTKTATLAEDVAPATFTIFLHLLTKPEHIVGGNYEIEGANRLTSWPFGVLLRLYVFEQSYDSRSFRNQVMAVMQVKACRDLSLEEPILEWDDHLDMVYENSIPGSPLRGFFVWLNDRLQAKSLDNQFALAHDELPSEYMAECLEQSMRRIQALQKRTCNEDEFGVCHSVNHSPKDHKPASLQSDWCDFHEHTNEEERKLCYAGFEAKMPGLR